MKITFCKYEALGNDFVFIDLMESPRRFRKLVSLAKAICDRRKGVGADGVLLLVPGSHSKHMMRLINADGSEAEMCGNGLRCIAHYLHSIGAYKEKINIDTLTSRSGIEIRIDKSGEKPLFKVNMPVPVTLPSHIPTTLGKDTAIEQPLATPIGILNLTCVSMGNPHAVVFLDDVRHLNLPLVGHAIESHPAFPRRTNVEFVKMLSREKAQVRVWERGCGETMACGSGACAVAVAANLTHRGSEKMEIILKGGTLKIEYSSPNSPVIMTGEANKVYTGELETRNFE